jgi:transposase
MTARKKTKKQSRQRYPDEYKAEAVKLAERVGTSAAAEELGIQASQIYNWRTKIRHAESSSDAENRLLTENASLKRQLAEQKEELALLKKASAYFAKNQK